MICMGIDSAGRRAGVALMRDEELLYEASLNAGLTHSETLLELADAAFRATGLGPEQVELYGVCAGPGSFTGLRIGLALCHPVAGTLVSALDARRGEVYWAAFEGPEGRRLCPDAAQKAEAAAEFCKVCKKPLFFVGDGALLCYNKIGPEEGAFLLPAALRGSRAVGVCLAARRMQAEGKALPPELLVPEYLRLSQAERERQEKLRAGEG